MKFYFDIADIAYATHVFVVDNHGISDFYLRWFIYTEVKEEIKNGQFSPDGLCILYLCSLGLLLCRLKVLAFSNKFWFIESTTKKR